MSSHQLRLSHATLYHISPSPSLQPFLIGILSWSTPSLTLILFSFPDAATSQSTLPIMSFNEDSTNNGWGASESTNDPPAGGAWGVGDMQDALGESEEPKPGPPPLPFEHLEAPKHEWVEPTQYNYTEDSSVEWDGNARVYHWDGVEGDVGPEYPELEAQIFGKPEDRSKPGEQFDK